MIEEDDAEDDFDPKAWEVIAALPNVRMQGWIDFAAVGIVGGDHPLFGALSDGDADVSTFFGGFTDEFGDAIRPAAVVRCRDAPPPTRGIEAMTGFMAAVAATTIIPCRCRWITGQARFGVLYSDVFDIYPWFPAPHHPGCIVSWRPSGGGLHELDLLRAQSAPGVQGGRLEPCQLDALLFDALRRRWASSFVVGDGSEDLRLFRSLDMARAAARAPGGVDASVYDVGRVIAAWVSAYEILAHDPEERGREKKLVHDLLMSNEFVSRDLQSRDHSIHLCRNIGAVETNLAGAIIGVLYGARNDFVHGNPIKEETTRFKGCEQPLHHFAAPIYRMLLAAHLGIDRAADRQHSDGIEDVEAFTAALSESIVCRAAQREIEEAILAAGAKTTSADDFEYLAET